MNWLAELVGNPFLITGISSWAIAQVVKTIIHAIIYKTLDFSRIFGDGGMPSGHSATVSSVAIFTALAYGVGSFQFALAAILAIIVCHDATGVRLETGKQALVIKELMKSVDVVFSDEIAEIKLKELVGHTPLQVVAGISIGVVNACVMYFVVYSGFSY